jgi:hypothetical protein
VDGDGGTLAQPMQRGSTHLWVVIGHVKMVVVVVGLQRVDSATTTTDLIGNSSSVATAAQHVPQHPHIELWCAYQEVKRRLSSLRSHQEGFSAFNLAKATVIRILHLVEGFVACHASQGLQQLHRAGRIGAEAMQWEVPIAIHRSGSRRIHGHEHRDGLGCHCRVAAQQVERGLPALLKA